MTIILTHLISWTIGTSALKLILKNTKSPFSLSTLLLLGFGAGYGISSFMTFFSFLMFQSLNASFLFLFHALLMLALLYLTLSIPKSIPEKNSKPSFKLSWIHGIYGLLILIWLGSLYFIATRHPYGEWDAWAMWNMKTKFLLLSPTPLEDILQKIHWHTHPDYPLSLPLFNTWIMSLEGGFNPRSPFWTAFLFAFAIGAFLLQWAHTHFKKFYAITISAVIITNPFINIISTQQYADVILAFFLLCTIFLLMKAIETYEKHFFLLYGLFLGFMSFIKNEGLVMAFLLLLLSVAFLFLNKQKHKENLKPLLIFLAIGFCITFSQMLIFKIFLAPPNTDIIPLLSPDNLKFVNVHRLLIVLKGFFTELTGIRWSLLWIFIGSLYVLYFKSLVKPKNLLFVAFFIIYFFIIVAIYLLNNQVDLAWWVETSLHRICFYLAPSLFLFALSLQNKTH